MLTMKAPGIGLMGSHPPFLLICSPPQPDRVEEAMSSALGRSEARDPTPCWHESSEDSSSSLQTGDHC